MFIALLQFARTALLSSATLCVINGRSNFYPALDTGLLKEYLVYGPGAINMALLRSEDNRWVLLDSGTIQRVKAFFV